jgi:hypothetical protein
MTDAERDKILAGVYKKVFFGHSTPQEGMLVFIDLFNHAEVIRDVEDTNATVYKHLGKRSIGLRILKLTEFTESDGTLGLKGISKLHVAIDDAAKLFNALVEAQNKKEVKE